MALKSTTITIESGRDAGKTFVITEMPVIKADNWAMRAIFAVANGGIDIGDIRPEMGMMGMAQVAVKALSRIDPDVGIPLLDELLECVQIVPSGGNARSIEFNSDISDVKTMFLLRKEVFVIHIDFLTQGGGFGLKN
ncbi:hypothetical protein KKJ01_17565 [Xenorhabdus bovienii]|uniref:Uncharacterized protein n=1 Tax=Xenorhabdus bovienii TaxID=40576 RepID=A0AAJ1JBZ7_XENBV|nr:hypothetical protein [Xenorhabdus bovienii]MDE1479977.1 hypothetical protein [Xenorhabdus bovienii]MDE9511674.1 hypothetical protein [Xenorhabdus bovienii]MDE9523316.1 hypothetical protein [Xenorhabdus bovienii]